MKRGVALVITVIMVAVITFLAIAFLVLTRREAASARTSTDQTIARLAAETAVERAKADLLAPILAFTNPLAFDLRVSTNYISPADFDATELDDFPSKGIGGQLDPSRFHWATNVSFTSRTHSPILPGSVEFAQVVANLYYDPRPPVFIQTNRAARPEFRYYLDLNRNGRYDTNGFLPVINTNGFFLTDGSGNVVSNFFVGDPEWIGVLERPEFPHSSSNRFTSRFAWIAVPAGKTLDVNSIHNDAKALPMTARIDGFLRNQGVGPWEINLGAFLTDLNTNLWDPPGKSYRYLTNLAARNTGAGFEDASALLRFRYAGDFNNLISVRNLFGNWGALAFGRDMIDGYSAGPLMTDTTPLGVDGDFVRVDRPWPGSESPQHIYTTQDFFDPAKDSPAFFNRLTQAGTNVSSYDRYTFYRLLSQLGTDAAPEDESKLNLNYVNVGGLRATNFVSWTDPALVAGNAAQGIPRFGVSGSLLFFTNAAHRLLWAHTTAWAGSNFVSFTNTFVVTEPFGITNIPVLVSNRLVYTPSVQRLLQLAANMYDAMTSSSLPNVFRPRFTTVGTNLFISGYEQVTGDPTSKLTPPLDMRAVPAGVNMPINVYGVPWIIGAKKGFPNFNEFAMQTVFDITRKLKVSRPSPSAPRSAYITNQLYSIGISNALAVEMWNSYRADFTNAPILVRVFGDVTMALTNQYGLARLNASVPLTNSFALFNWPVTNVTRWVGYGSATVPNAQSFIVPLQTNIAFVPGAIWLNGTRELSTNLAAFPPVAGFPVPCWGLVAKTRLRCVMQLGGATGPIVDYVNLDGMDDVRDLAAEFSRVDASSPGWGMLWETNRPGVQNDSSPTRGIIYQTRISLGEFNADSVDWKEYGPNPADRSKTLAITKFRAFMGLSPLTAETMDVATNLSMQVPFSPSRRISHYQTWQANDPLVHYLAADLRARELDSGPEDKSVRPGATLELLENIGRLNVRYRPWGGNPQKGTDANKFNLALKDPLVRSSDDWDFPANKFPNVGWLGRVHRGTPWQTVYLKSSDLGIQMFPVPMTNAVIWANNPNYAAFAVTWSSWSGHENLDDAFYTRPVNDRMIFDLFTAALSDTAARGQLSINQSGLAAWSALFGGVLAVTNVMTDDQVQAMKYTIPRPAPTYGAVAVEPAGPYPPGSPDLGPPLLRLVQGTNGINQTRANMNLFPNGTFTRLGDILAVPALTVQSPFLNRSTAAQTEGALSDAAYERLPQQVLGLLSVGTPRFVIYGFGQTLRPADNSVIPSGPFFQMCTNYQVTAETAIRAVVRVDGAPAHPRVAVESFNVLPPD